jgi:hypothetical protein
MAQSDPFKRRLLYYVILYIKERFVFSFQLDYFNQTQNEKNCYETHCQNNQTKWSKYRAPKK